MSTQTITLELTEQDATEIMATAVAAQLFGGGLVGNGNGDAKLTIAIGRAFFPDDPAISAKVADVAAQRGL